MHECISCTEYIIPFYSFLRDQHFCHYGLCWDYEWR